jgi:hypothetical protein
MNRITMAPTVAEISVRKKPFAGVDFSYRRTSLSGVPLGGGPRRRWKIRHFARAAPKLDAKFALELHRFSQRFGIVIRHDGLHGDRTLVRTDYEGPVWIRLAFPGCAERSLYSAKPTGRGRQRSLKRSVAATIADLAAVHEFRELTPMRCSLGR